MESIREMLKSFKNVVADAVPRPPRSSKSEKIRSEPEVSNANDDEPEEIIIESEDYYEEEYVETKKDKKERKNSVNGKEKKSKTKSRNTKESVDENGYTTYANLQGNANVTNIINGKDIQIGPSFTFNSTVMQQPRSNTSQPPEQHIQKCNRIKLVMEADAKLDFDYMDHVSKNLGKNWHAIYMKLGYSRGAIETMEIDCKAYGVAEARYRLLLEWRDKDDNNNLGRLATLLWKEGEREIVRDLALMYNKGR